MKYKMKYFEVNNGKIILHIKKPLFKKTQEALSYFDYKFSDNNESYLGSGLDIDGNIILMFVLRNFERDIKPYIKFRSDD